MSKGARISFGIVFLLGAVAFLFFAIIVGREIPVGPLPLYGMAAACALIGIACLSPRTGWLSATLPLTLLTVALAVVATDFAHLANHALIVLALASLALILALGYCYYLRRKFSWASQALAMAQRGDADGAIAFLHAHLDRNGPSVSASNTLGVVFAMKQDWQQALEHFEEAESLGDTSPVLLNNKGFALWRLGRSHEALVCLMESSRRQPRDATTIINCGLILAEHGRFDEARAYLDRAEQLVTYEMRSDARRSSLEQLRQKIAIAK